MRSNNAGQTISPEKNVENVEDGDTRKEEEEVSCGQCGEAEEEDEEEEGVKAKLQKVQELPGKEEVEIHNLTHVPYRSWCPHCIKGAVEGIWTSSSRSRRAQSCNNFHGRFLLRQS